MYENENPLAPGCAFPDFREQIVDLSTNGPDFDRGIDETRGTDDLLDDHAPRAPQRGTSTKLRNMFAAAPATAVSLRDAPKHARLASSGEMLTSTMTEPDLLRVARESQQPYVSDLFTGTVARRPIFSVSVPVRKGDEIRIEGVPDGRETAALDYIEIAPADQP